MLNVNVVGSSDGVCKQEQQHNTAAAECTLLQYDWQGFFLLTAGSALTKPCSLLEARFVLGSTLECS
jgi:hypothetical protein